MPVQNMGWRRRLRLPGGTVEIGISGKANKNKISTSWYNKDSSMNYPLNNDAVSGTEQMISLKPGDVLGRYGNIGEDSNFVTQPGVDPNELSLSPNTDPAIYQKFIVVKEILQTTQI